MQWDKKVYEIYNAYTNRMLKYYDIECVKTQVLLKESELLYGFDADKLQTYASLKKRLNNLRNFNL